MHCVSLWSFFHFKVVVIPVITQRQIPMVLVTREILLLLDKVSTSLLCRSCGFLGGGPDVQKTVVPTVEVPSCR